MSLEFLVIILGKGRNDPPPLLFSSCKFHLHRSRSVRHGAKPKNELKEHHVHKVMEPKNSNRILHNALHIGEGPTVKNKQNDVLYLKTEFGA